MTFCSSHDFCGFATITSGLFSEFAKKLECLSPMKRQSGDAQKLPFWECFSMVIGGCLPSQRKRLSRAVNTLRYLLGKKKATVKDLESLAGLLNFLNRAIFPGRAFTHRMYAKFAGARDRGLHS